jgi:hypothetical protein
MEEQRMIVAGDKKIAVRGCRVGLDDMIADDLQSGVEIKTGLPQPSAGSS